MRSSQHISNFLTLQSIQFRSPRLLPPQGIPEKPTLVLDLDHTLICSTQDHPPARYDFIISYELDGVSETDYVLKRPGLDQFLEKLSTKYELVIFTAGMREYASRVVDQIDPSGLISHRLYRESCTIVSGQFVKGLGDLGRELKKVILVEDKREACVLNPENAMLVPPFVDDLEDAELGMLRHYLEISVLDKFEDLRDAVTQYNKMGLGDDVLRAFPRATIWQF
ncbi:unnamed protein product [Rhodiola kirilowii]